MTRNNERQNNIQDVSIAVIEEKVGKIELWIDNADRNHFPTIEKRFDGLEKKLAYWGGAVAAFGAIVQVIIKAFF